MDMTEIRRLEEQKVGTLKLSEAIRIGARMRPERREGFAADGKSCAIMAMAEGSGFTYQNSPGHQNIYAHLEAAFPNVQRDIFLDISARHFFGRESREQIADWLESQGL